MSANTMNEQAIREDLAAAYQLVALEGMDDGIETHISARLPNDRFLLNAYGLRFDEIRADNLVIVDAGGEVLDDPTGLGINPAGFTIHSALHEARPEVHCVLHTHTVAGVALSCLEEGLLPLNQWALQFFDRLSYHDFEGIALDLEERERLARDLGQNSAMILRQHGLLTCGQSVGEAFLRMRDLERSCRAQLAAQGTGQALITASREMGEYVAQQYEVWAAGEAGTGRAWQAERRRLKSREG
ncbi:MULTISPECIES: class II aldolase/adducin family protein [unclassified Halomonas]|uniref:class II aldolase/adducin family protein n=1 Tax=unclassified Halomonas TaxID=2609666 RepID=UPI0021E49D97|nr:MULTISPECIES: class II aldolase/adducin family protein [unclassified Halomonas]UYF98931.1 class II aldolase/adducin family protein [Halomonas sp. GD1P12]WNL39951.1 class II aldolase/adducin family protein [Halomonas sp. PAMB 3232]